MKVSSFTTGSWARLALSLCLVWLLAGSAGRAAGGAPVGPVPGGSIRVVMDDNYPPCIFRAADGSLKGILVDQWALWARKTGIRVQLDAMDWGEAQRRMAAGRYDVIDTIFESEQRKALYDFSSPYMRIDVPIFFSKELAGIRGPRDLNGFIVGAKEGDNSIEILKAAGVSNFLLFKNYETLIAAARDGKIKVFTVDGPPAHYFLIKMGIQDQFRESESLYSGAFHRAVRKGDQALLAEVQRGFDLISKSEYAAIERQWYGAPIATRRDLRTVAWSAAGAGCFLGLLLLWVWMLRRNVRLRTRELQLSESRFRSIFEDSPIGIWEEDFSLVKASLDAIRGAGNRDLRAYLADRPEEVERIAGQVRILDINHASILTLKAGSKDEIIRNLPRFFTEDSLPVFREELVALAEGRTRFRAEIPHLDSDGNLLILDLNLSVQSGCEATLARVLVSFVDITDRKRKTAALREAHLLTQRAETEIRRLNEGLEQRVKDRTAQLEAANREMEAFSYSVSHDLRAPLRGIDGFSLVLLEDYQDVLDATGRRHLERIRSGTQRMGQLIEDLLKLSRIHRSELDLGEVDLTLICGEVLAELAGAGPGRAVEVSLQPGLRAQADASLIRVALENLLGNAWKFTARRGDPRIAVGQTLTPGGVRAFFVRDNGAGFDPAYAGKLFHAFERLHSAQEFEGTGIGLAIVQRIVHRHGGRIWAEAEPDRGATFFFTLPGPAEG